MALLALRTPSAAQFCVECVPDLSQHQDSQPCFLGQGGQTVRAIDSVYLFVAVCLCSVAASVCVIALTMSVNSAPPGTSPLDRRLLSGASVSRSFVPTIIAYALAYSAPVVSLTFITH